MGKALALLVAGGGVTAITVGGVYLFRGNGTSRVGETADTITPQAVSSKVSNKILADSWSDFQTDGKASECFTRYFQGLNLQGSSNTISSDNIVGSGYFSAAGSSRSCLILN